MSFLLEIPCFYRRLIVIFHWRPLIFTGDSLSFFIDDPLLLPETHCLFSLKTPYFYRRLIVFFIGDPLFYRRLIDFLFLLKTPWFRRKPIFHWKPLLCSGITFSMRVLLYFNWRRSPLVFSHEKLGLVGSLWNKKQLKKKTLMESLWMWFNRSTQIKLKRLWKLSNVFKTSVIYYN